MSKKRLGRGLDALLSQPAAQDDAPVETIVPEAVASAGSDIAVGEIHPSPYQPRRHFDDEALKELADSIRNQGLLQPLVVRSRPQGGYELIAGERRWRAAQLAEMTHVPVVVREVNDAEASAFALIENIQREDLTALEEAQGLARLRDEFELTQQEIADAVGKSRVAVANLLRLLNLGSVTRSLLESGEIEMGHARALLALDGHNQDITARQIADQELSVRQAEALVRKIASGATASKTKAPAKDADTQRLEHRLTERLGAMVSINHSASGKGEVRIKYSSLDELDGVLKHMGVDQDSA